VKVWLCAMKSAAGFVAHKWLCRKHGIARREERDDLGRLVWSKVTAERVIDQRCDDCETERQENLPDHAAELRRTRAATRDTGRLVRYSVGGKLIERPAASFAVIPNAGDGAA
jgi:hypothetical protein